MSEVLTYNDYVKAEKIIEYIDKKGEISPKHAEVVSGKSSATVRRYLNTLVETGFVEPQGSTNNQVYKRVK